MTIKKMIATVILFGISNQLLAQEALSQKCYQAINPTVLTIDTDGPQMTGQATSAMLVYEYSEDQTSSDLQLGSAINIHAYSQSPKIYYTSGGIGYDNTRKLYAGDCDAGLVKAQFTENGKYVELRSEGYRGTALVLGECSNALLSFKQPLKLELLPDNTCKEELKMLLVLPEEDIQ